MKNTFAILSGKGGAGKTILAVNIAAGFSEKKGRTLLVDADFGLPNSHIMMGLNPARTVEDFILDHCSFKEAVEDVSPTLSILAGKSGSAPLLNLSQDNGQKIWHGIRSVETEFDYVVIDNSAGAENHTMSLSCNNSNLIISLVDLPTNFLDAYSTIKIANQEHNIKDFHICINQCNSYTGAQKIFQKFDKITTRFLDVSLELVGFLPKSTVIESSISDRLPFYNNKKTREYSFIDNIIKNLDSDMIQK
ncbi:MAG: AAA family ATPase [Rhodospirillaceae bacterium]